MKLSKRFERWATKPYKKPFPTIFILVSYFYTLATLYDFSTAYLNFRVMYGFFMKYEASEMIKLAFHGDGLAVFLATFIFLVPMTYVCILAFVTKKRYGHVANITALGLIILIAGGFAHIWGALTNIAGTIITLGG